MITPASSEREPLTKHRLGLAQQRARRSWWCWLYQAHRLDIMEPSAPPLRQHFHPRNPFLGDLQRESIWTKTIMLQIELSFRYAIYKEPRSSFSTFIPNPLTSSQCFISPYRPIFWNRWALFFQAPLSLVSSVESIKALSLFPLPFVVALWEYLT